MSEQTEMEGELLRKQLAEAWKKRRMKSVWDTEERAYITINGASSETPTISGARPETPMDVVSSDSNTSNTTPPNTSATSSATPPEPKPDDPNAPNSQTTPNVSKTTEKSDPKESKKAKSPTFTFNTLSPIKAYKLVERYINPLKKSTKRLKDGSFTAQIPREELNLVTQVCLLGDIPVKIEKHTFLNRCRGLIKDKDRIQMEEEEIKEELSEYRVTSVTKKQYYDKEKRRKVYSGVVLLTFDRETLPETVNLAYLSDLKVKQHEPNPRQCFKCWQLGNHGEEDCKEEEVCGWCSQKSTHKEAGEKCANDPKCKNCLGNHPNWKKDCPVYLMEKEVQRIKEVDKVPYPRAKQIVEERANPSHRGDYANVAGRNVITLSEHQRIVNEIQATHANTNQKEIATLNAEIDYLKQNINYLVDTVQQLMKNQTLNPETTKITENIKAMVRPKPATNTGPAQTRQRGPPPPYTTMTRSYGNPNLDFADRKTASSNQAEESTAKKPKWEVNSGHTVITQPPGKPPDNTTY